MTSPKRIAGLAATFGLVATGLVVAGQPASAATRPTCYTSVVGVTGGGRILEREVKNTTQLDQEVSAPLPYQVESLTAYPGERVGDTFTSYFAAYRPGQRPHNLSVEDKDSDSVLRVTEDTRFAVRFNARLVANSGNYFAYGIDPRGNLKRWTRYGDDQGHLWYADGKVVQRHAGGFKTLSWSTVNTAGGIRRDVLWGTTRGGALKQIQVPWRRPGNPKVAVLRKTGFASFTGLSMGFCNDNQSYASFVLVDKVHNRARLFTLRNQFTPKSANLVRRGLVAPGANWRLHAVV